MRFNWKTWGVITLLVVSILSPAFIGAAASARGPQAAVNYAYHDGAPAEQTCERVYHVARSYHEQQEYHEV